MRDRQLNLQAIADRRNPDRERPAPPVIPPEGEPPKKLHRLFKGVDITRLKKGVEFMRTLDKLGPIPAELVDENLLSRLMASHWAYPEPTSDGYGTVIVVSESRRHEWDPPWYTRAGKKLGKKNPDLAP